MKSKDEELKKEVYEYWKKNEKLTLAELNDKINNDFLKSSDFVGEKISNELILEWLRKENKK